MSVVTSAEARGSTTEAALGQAIQVVLMSPHFLFRVELDPDPTSTVPHPLSPYELASRLSYFLWSTMPDAALFAAADADNLQDPAVLNTQVSRMLRDPKAGALVQNFGGAWLLANELSLVTPDPTLFPKFDNALRSAMQQETLLLFQDIALGGVSASQLMTANYTYVNDRLAAHYGLPAVGSTRMTKVSLAGSSRAGFLSQGSFLTYTSHPDRTSPTGRGHAILTQLLCQDVPPAPAGVKTTIPPLMPGASLRQTLEAHRSNPSCASCHQLMDPVGFGLENFDAIGAYRTQDNGVPIDATGVYPDGANTEFQGAQQLSALVAADPRLNACLIQSLYTYALGRVPVATAGSKDPSTMDRLVHDFTANGLLFEPVVHSLVAGDTFLKRRGEHL
jgi:hypothetical protein